MNANPMNIEPMINARFKRFRTQFELMNIPDGSAFERFVNYNIFSNHRPGVFSGDNELFDLVCVGDMDDMGIDGIAIVINGVFIRNIEEAKEIAGKFKKVNAEFIFVQTKYKLDFDKKELNNFIDGVRDFLSDTHRFPMNEKIKSLLKIKEYILTGDEEGDMMWDGNPSVRLYYVAMGNWKGSQHQQALIDQFNDDIGRLNIYSKEIPFHYVDSGVLKSICDSNENTFKASINIIEAMPLTSVCNVENSCIILCYADELVKLLTNEDNQSIRKSLFYDNVRDYLGDNNINDEIQTTIEKEPEKFILLNNGLTIVCDSYQQSNRRIIINNPQIVNGCQTSHVLFYAKQQGLNINKVPLNIKIIATEKSDITNQIVRGTNRQNIVYDETFEVTRDFHKNLEEYIGAVSEDYVRLYYERRTKQFQDNPTIRQSQKVTLRILIQSFVGMFLNDPDVAYRHESKLLKDYQNKIFLWDKNIQQAFKPYFVAILSNYYLEKMFRENQLDRRDFYTYRHHILMLFREIIAGPSPNINNTSQIEQYSQVILDVLKSEYQTQSYFNKAVRTFKSCRDIWINDLGKSPHGIKDIADFKKLLLSEVRKEYKHEEYFGEDENAYYRGVVLNVKPDRYGNFYGYIKMAPNNIFFHSSYNPKLDFTNLKGKLVSYKVSPNLKTGGFYATEIRVVDIKC